jgi:hypothetical protein
MTTGFELVASAIRAAPPRAARLRLEPVHGAHPARVALEDFIVARFGKAYGARVSHFLPHLIGLRDGLAWKAAAGYAAAGARALFLEQYLDRPIECAIEHALGQPVARADVVEVGNLAAVSAGMTRVLIPQLARYLHRLGYRWVAFTATRGLRNSFHRLGLKPLSLASADPSRLTDGGASWGTYYAQDPEVVVDRISRGLRSEAHP